jgi:hypothetical protein
MSGSSTPDRVFVGGTGRCGTHALSSVLGHHAHYRRVHTELRFHADPTGLPGLLKGEIELSGFLEQLRGRWWRRTSRQGRQTGFFKRLPEERFNASVSKFERDFPSDQWGASSTLIHELIDPIAAQAKKPGWVEMTKRTVWAAPILLKLVPDAKLIHIIRDGRDCAASIATQAWGPEDFEGSLDWWEERVGISEQGAAGVDPERLLVLSFEDFVAEDREASYDRLVEFIGSKGFLGRRRAREMRRYYDDEIGGPKANRDRWRKGRSQDEQDQANERYAQALHRLIAADTPARPVFESFLASIESPAVPV